MPSFTVAPQFSAHCAAIGNPIHQAGLEGACHAGLFLECTLAHFLEVFLEQNIAKLPSSSKFSLWQSVLLGWSMIIVVVGSMDLR